MSVRTRSIGTPNPALFSQNGGFGLWIDAPPHITELRLKMVFSGTRTETVGTITRTETLSYTKEKTFTRIELLRDSTTTGVSEGAEFSTPDILTSIDLVPDDPDECRIVNLHWGNFEAPVSPQMARAPIEMYYQRDLWEVAGSWDYADSANPGDDDSGDIIIASWPGLFFSQEPGMDEYREPMTRWGGALGDNFVIPYHTPFGVPTSADPAYIDVSGWDFLEWRSKNGIYSFTLTESGYRTSGTSSAEGTFEWELS
jgi:hypothetical protein